MVSVCQAVVIKVNYMYSTTLLKLWLLTCLPLAKSFCLKSLTDQLITNQLFISSGKWRTIKRGGCMIRDNRRGKKGELRVTLFTWTEPAIIIAADFTVVICHENVTNILYECYWGIFCRYNKHIFVLKIC